MSYPPADSPTLPQKVGDTSPILGTSLLAWLCIVSSITPADASPQHTAGRIIPASELVEGLAGGKGVDEFGVRVTGDVDLRPLETVKRPFRCRACTFSGAINATDVVVDSIIDLSGTTIEGSLLLTGARLRAPFILDGMADNASEVKGRTDLRLARFSDSASWERTRLLGPVDATSAQFNDGASFVAATFLGPATFERARFGLATSFADASTQGLHIARAVFGGAADFRQHRFEGTSNFTGVVFEETADFTLAGFKQDAQFDTATFGRDVSFRLVQAPFATLRNTQAAGAVVFDGAILERGGSFAGSSLLGVLSLRELQTLTADNALELDQVAAPVIRLEVSAVNLVRGASVRQEVLTLLEEDAKADGNLQLANDARFQRMTLQAARKGPLQRLLDRAIFREIAGYLVRPLYPLRALLFLLVIGASVRAFPTWSRNLRPLQASVPDRRHKRKQRRAAGEPSGFGVFLWGLYASLRQAFAKTSGVDWQAGEALSKREGARGVEFLAGKALIALFLLSLGNSNATVREIIDAVRSGG